MLVSGCRLLIGSVGIVLCGLVVGGMVGVVLWVLVESMSLFLWLFGWLF